MDPGETENLVTKNEEMARKSLESLERHETAARQGAAEAVEQTLSAEAADQLKKLGYFKDAGPSSK